MQVMACGLKVVKFFPANVYGGLIQLFFAATPL